MSQREKQGNCHVHIIVTNIADAISVDQENNVK